MLIFANFDVRGRSVHFDVSLPLALLLLFTSNHTIEYQWLSILETKLNPQDLALSTYTNIWMKGVSQQPE